MAKYLERPVAPVPASLSIALKEWSVTIQALAAGRQILLLRKGGISEANDTFTIEHPQFLLFPTYLHQTKQMVKEPERAQVEAWPEEPSQITLTTLGVVTDIVQIKSRAQMDALDDQHIWTAPLIDMRFNYKPQNPLYLVLVRAYELTIPTTTPNTPAYAGCKSWVPLDHPVPTKTASPVLQDNAYAYRRTTILNRLASA